MTLHFVRRFLWCATAVLLVSLAAGPSRAQSVVSIQTGALPPLAADEPIAHLTVLDGRPIALGSRSAWTLDERRGAWERVGFHPRGELTGVISDGRRAWSLLASHPGGPSERVERLALAGPADTSPPWPSLPTPLSLARGAVLGETLYVTGTTALGAPRFFALALDAPRPSWDTLPAWPGRALGPSSIVAQANALWVTLAGEPGAPDRLVRWSMRDGWTARGSVAGTVVAGAARATGQAHVLYLVRDAMRPDAPLQLRSYQTITGAWATLADPRARGARAAAAWRNGFLWSGGTLGGLGARVATVEIETGRRLLGWLDWTVIAVYLVSMIGMGLYFYRREKRVSTAEFFVGGRTIPFWAAGVSLYAANTSSISYIAIPAKSFETNWQYLSNSLITVLGLIFVAIWIVPLLRRLDLMSVFQYLETRFHPVIRTLASGLFIAVQIGSRMSVILFLPSLAIATMTGISVVWSVVIMGAFTIIYTAMGGMKAVIWTDLVQLIVKMGGIFFAMGFIVFKLRGGARELIHTAVADHKTRLFDFSFDLTKATVWGFVFLVLFDVVLTFPKDQVLMQRVLSTRSSRDAGRSVWTFAAIMIPGGFMFYTVGTALYVFYKRYPERMNPLLAIDATFPFFIAAELPMGIRGLIIAGILAAAMATLSSIMNSVATLASVDFYEKLVTQPDPRVSVRFAEAMTVATGLAGVAVACVLSRYDIHSLFDVSIELAGLLGGGFAGAYTLGMFTRRANWQGVMVGVMVSITVTTAAWYFKLVHPYFYLAISICACVVVGYLASWLFPPPPPHALRGLTIYGAPAEEQG